ncbi:hypothetical protein MRB53_041457 [Persea americana]|nr:hypothetical protein MRB53_041457 [Persea americana]
MPHRQLRAWCLCNVHISRALSIPENTTVDVAAQQLRIDQAARAVREHQEKIRHSHAMRAQAERQRRQEMQLATARAQQEAHRQLQRGPGGYVNVYGHPSNPETPLPEPSIYEPLKKTLKGMSSAMGAALGRMQPLFTGDLHDLGQMLNGAGPSSSSRAPWDEFDDDVFGNADPAELAADLKNLMDQIRPDDELPIDEADVAVPTMTVKLKPYQGTGLTWLQNMEDGTNKGGILADDMGLGKTIQAIALMTTRRSENFGNRTTLIVAPVALLRQWKQEIESKMERGRNRFTVFIHHSTQKKKTHAELRQFDVVLTTFGTIASEMRKRDNYLKRKEIDRQATPNATEKCIFIGDDCKWYRVIIDEAQNIKNRETQSARGAYHLQAEYRLCMSGTPMMNSVDELHSLIKFLRIRPYNDWNRFRSEFSQPLRREHGREQAMAKLQALLKAILLRRHKKTLVNGKPILVLPERVVERTDTVFTDEEKDFYKALETQSRTTFNKYVRAGTVGNKYAHILVMLLRLRQACCHPHLVKDFGVMMAADISPETMEKFAAELDASTVARIKATNGDFECPVCYDAVPNPAIFIPCGHDTCPDCYVKIKDAAANDFGENAGHAKCPNCRGRIDPKRVIDYEIFKKVHVPAEAAIEAADAVSDTETDPDETASESDSEDDSSETEGDTDSLADFVVNDSDDDDFGKSRRKSGRKQKLKREPIDELDDESSEEDVKDGKSRREVIQSRG